MERPLVFFVIVGIALVLAVYYGGSSIFNSGPIATGPGQGIGLQTPGGLPPLGFGQGGTAAQKREPGVSPFQGTVRIATVRYSESNFRNEYFILDASNFSSFGVEQQKTIHLDGWTIENNKGERHAIPAALNILFVDATSRPIELHAGDEVLVATGDSPFASSFQENVCTGYLNESYALEPPLAESCPQFSRAALLSHELNGQCVDLIYNAPRCRQVNIGFEQSGAGNDCVLFSAAHLNYAGCVKDNRASDKFFTGRWRAFLNLKQKLWEPIHDRAILRDKDGLVVDEYVY